MNMQIGAADTTGLNFDLDGTASLSETQEVTMLGLPEHRSRGELGGELRPPQIPPAWSIAIEMNE